MFELFAPHHQVRFHRDPVHLYEPLIYDHILVFYSDYKTP
jgi:hypothetical protein